MLESPPRSNHPEVACDLTQGRGVAFLLHRLLDESEDCFLACGDGIHMNTSLAERDWECQEEIPDGGIAIGVVWERGKRYLAGIYFGTIT